MASKTTVDTCCDMCPANGFCPRHVRLTNDLGKAPVPTIPLEKAEIYHHEGKRVRRMVPYANEYQAIYHYKRDRLLRMIQYVKKDLWSRSNSHRERGPLWEVARKEIEDSHHIDHDCYKPCQDHLREISLEHDRLKNLIGQNITKYKDEKKAHFWAAHHLAEELAMNEVARRQAALQAIVPSWNGGYAQQYAQGSYFATNQQAGPSTLPRVDSARSEPAVLADSDTIEHPGEYLLSQSSTTIETDMARPTEADANNQGQEYDLNDYTNENGVEYDPNAYFDEYNVFHSPLYNTVGTDMAQPTVPDNTDHQHETNSPAANSPVEPLSTPEEWAAAAAEIEETGRWLAMQPEADMDS